MFTFFNANHEDTKGDDVTTEVSLCKKYRDKFIEKVKAKVQLLDKEEATVESNEDYKVFLMHQMFLCHLCMQQENLKAQL